MNFSQILLPLGLIFLYNNVTITVLWFAVSTGYTQLLIFVAYLIPWGFMPSIVNMKPDNRATTFLFLAIFSSIGLHWSFYVIPEGQHFWSYSQLVSSILQIAAAVWIFSFLTVKETSLSEEVYKHYRY